MEQKIKKIIRQVGDIGEKISRLQVEKPLPSIEIDIILGKIRALYEKVGNLQLETSIPDREKLPETKDQEAETSPGNIPAAATATGQEQTAETTATVKKAGKSSEQAILADKYQEEKKFINESLAENGRKADISSKITSKPIRNISSALGINDRFKLVNDLFNGDRDSYQNAINILDGASNFNEAFNYITSSFDWDMEEESVQILLELVRRKFIVNQDE